MTIYLPLLPKYLVNGINVTNPINIKPRIVRLKGNLVKHPISIFFSSHFP